MLDSGESVPLSSLQVSHWVMTGYFAVSPVGLPEGVVLDAGLALCLLYSFIGKLLSSLR